MKIFQSRDLMSKLNISKLPSSVLTKVLCNFFRLVLDQDHWLRVKNCSASIDVVILLTSFRINGWRLKTISTASITNADKEKLKVLRRRDVIRILQEFVRIKQIKVEFFKTSERKNSRLCFMFVNFGCWAEGVENYENIKPRLFIYSLVIPES